MLHGKISDVALGALHEIKSGHHGAELSETSVLLRRLVHDFYPPLFDLCYWRQVEVKLGYKPAQDGHGHVVFIRMMAWYRLLKRYPAMGIEEKRTATARVIRFCDAMAHSIPSHQ